MINSYKNSINECRELSELFELANEEKNKIVLDETLKNFDKLKLKTKKNEIKCFLSNESDSLNSYVEIHAGAGGTESQDWAEMLRKMYMK